MSLCANRMSQAHRTLLRYAFICALCLLPNSLVVAEGELERSPSRTTASGLPLPPRANGHDGAAASRPKATSNDGGLWTTVIALGAIVGVLMLAGRWLKPYLGAPRGLPIEALELLGRRMIEPKVSIHLVRCGGKVLMLGVSPDGVRTLSEISDPHEVNRLTEACLTPVDSRQTTNSHRTATSRDTSATTGHTRQREPRIAAFSSNEEATHV